MKKLLTIALLIFATGANAQTIKLRVIKLIVIAGDEKPDERAVDFMATINKPKAKIRIYADKEFTYDLIKVLKMWNEEGSPHVRYKALDSTGEECIIETVDFTSSLNIAVTYTEQKVSLIYKMDYE